MKHITTGLRFPCVIGTLSCDINKFIDINIDKIMNSGLDVYKQFLNKKFSDNDKHYFRRSVWPNGYFIRLSLCTKNSSHTSKDIYDQTNAEVIKKVQAGDLLLGLDYIFCIVDDNSIEEKMIVVNNHCVNNNDLFANDWEEHLITK